MGNRTAHEAGNSGWQLASVMAYLAMVATNALANSLPLFGRTTGAVSDRYPTLFTPAPYTFAVWGLIYLLLAGFVAYQALPAPRRDARLAGLRPLFVLSCALNVAWLVSWHALAISLSELLMLALLLTLVAAYVRGGLWRIPAPAAARWLVDLPFAVYLGWISVATIANTAIFLLDQGFDGGSAATGITVLMVVAAAGLGLFVLARRRDPAFALVVAWGLAGVAVARAGQPAAVAAVGWACAAVLVVLSALTLVRRHRSPGGAPRGLGPAA